MWRNEFYERVFDEVLRLSVDGFIVVDTKGIVTDINDRYCEFLGKKRDQIVGKLITETIPNSKMVEIMKNEYMEEQVLHKYERGYVKDESNDFVLVSRSYVKNSSGDIIGGVAQVHFRDQSVQSARKMMKIYNELEYLREQYYDSSQTGVNDIIGNSKIMQTRKKEAMKASKTNFSVLLTGESGTGKEVFARAIHNSSQRKDRPFVSVNCAAIPGDLLEAELFGYEEGAFTGAKKGGRKGKFILADGGTLFLDEIGDMPLIMQAKLLRALQEQEVDTIGGTKPVKVDIRIISATRQNLEHMIKKGTFREDLYYRLNVINIDLPPLRERCEDIPGLAKYFIKRLNKEYNRSVTYAPKVIEILCKHNWPGNVRELDNVIKGAYAVCDNFIIEPSDLPGKLRKDGHLADSEVNYDATAGKRVLEAVHDEGSMKKYLDGIEARVILEAYEKFHSVRKAAAYLGMSMPTYVRKLHQYSE